MQVSMSKKAVNFRTYYSEKYDMIQKYCGIAEGNFEVNNTVDCIEAGLVIRDKGITGTPIYRCPFPMTKHRQ